MIAWLEGSLREKAPTRVVLDVRGVGYELLIPLSTYAALPDEGKTVALYVHTVVREDAIQLFGFASERERAVFEVLLRASRLGPKLAQSILSGIAPDALLEAICDGDLALLVTVPGVGRKLAERIVVELRDRAAELRRHRPSPTGGAAAPIGPVELGREALSALVNLGYPRAKAERVVESTAAEMGKTGARGEEASLEELIRVALRRLAQ